MTAFRILVLLLALALLPCQAQDVSAGYSSQPLPSAWINKGVLRSRLTLADVTRPAQPPLRVSEFIARFGLPDRYLVPNRRQHGYSGMLVYDLPSKHTVILHVGTPPLQNIGAIAVRDRHNKVVRLIK